MFDHKHYVPLLKAKGGEFWALGNLKPSTKHLVTPVLELVPFDTKKTTFDKDLASKVDGLCGCWPDLPFFFDVRHAASKNELPTPATLNAAFKRLRSHKANGIPVTRLGYSQKFQEALKAIVETDKKGLMIRLGIADLAIRDKLQAALENLCSFLGATEQQVDLLIDYGYKHPDEHEDLMVLQILHFSKIPHIAKWRTLTLASASFPASIKDLPDKEWVPLDRTEWKTWMSFVSSGKTTRPPSYGDYAIRHPSLPGFGTPKPNLRYTLEDKYLCRRDDARHIAMKEICRSLVNRSEYMGTPFSIGDWEISKTAAKPGSAGSGNPQNWTEWCSNHHFELVATQIRNLPSS